MTYRNDITPSPAPEEPRGFSHTPISQEFSGLLTALGTAIEAERDTFEIDMFDLACRNWLDAAETGWQRVTEITGRILAAAPARFEDKALQQVAFLIRFAVGIENRDDSAVFNRLVDLHTAIFHCSGRTPVGRRVNRMIDAALVHYRTLDWLIFDDEPDMAAPAISA